MQASDDYLDFRASQLIDYSAAIHGKHPVMTVSPYLSTPLQHPSPVSDSPVPLSVRPPVQPPHLGAREAARLDGGDLAVLVLVADAGEVLLGQTDQLLVIHAAGAGQHHTRTLVVVLDVVDQVLTADGPGDARHGVSAVGVAR